MAKRPWLLTQIGMRLSVVLAFAISVAAVAPALWQFSEDQQRQLVSQLDPKAITYCEIEACGSIEKLSGLTITSDVEITESEYATEVRIRVINSGRLSGTREVWAQARTKEGTLVEGMRTILRLTEKGPQFINLSFTGTASELKGLRLFLGF